MPSRYSWRSGLAFAVVLTAGLASPASAAETANSEFVIIQEDDVISDDLYAGGIEVDVRGEIDGDLVAAAAESIVIDGGVTGSMFVMSPRVVINGDVGGAVRVIANDLVITGSVGGDVVGTVVDADLSSMSLVTGDLLVWGVSVAALGAVGGDVLGSQTTLRLGGHVDGDVDVGVGVVEAVEPLTVGGDFGYRSARQGVGLDMADVEGAIVHKMPLPPNVRVRALGVFGSLMAILFLTAVSLGVAWTWPDRTRAAMDKVREKPFGSWGRGVLVMLVPVFAAAAMGLLIGLAPASASFPLLLIEVPIVLALFGALFAVGLFAGAPVVGVLGERLFKSWDIHRAVAVGSLTVGLIWLLPWVGVTVPIVVLPMGLGAWTLSWRGTVSGDTVDRRQGASRA